MKTKLMTITGILAAMLIVPMAFAADGRPGARAGQGFDDSAPMAQQRQALQDLTPEQRQRVREFVQSLVQEQRQQGQMPGRGQGYGPQAFAGRRQGRGQGFGAQGRAFAQEDFRGRGQGQRQRSFRGQGRMERPQAGQGQQQCPRCGQPMARQGGQRPDGPRAFAGRRQGRAEGFGPQAFAEQRANRRPWWGAPEDRPYAQQDSPRRPQGRMMQRPSQDRMQRPELPRDERPFGPQGMQGRGRGQGFGPQIDPNAQQDFRGRGQGRGFGPRAFDDAEGDRSPQADKPQEVAPQRQRRNRVLMEPESERLGDDLQQQPRPERGENAQ